MNRKNFVALVNRLDRKHGLRDFMDESEELEMREKTFKVLKEKADSIEPDGEYYVLNFGKFKAIMSRDYYIECTIGE